MQMIDLMKRLAELDAKNPNVVKENQSGKIGTMGRDIYPGEVEKMRATRAKMDSDAEWLLKNKPTDPCSKCGDSTTYRSSFGTSQSLVCARCGKVRLSTDDREGVSESDDDLVGMVQSTIEDILSGAQRGHDMTDNIADELGDHFDAVQNSGDETLQQAYSMVRDAADTSPEEQAQAAQSALEMLSGGSEQGVAEGSEQVFKVVAVSKSNALEKPTTLNVKASSLDEVFERLAINDWYPLEINGIEVIKGKRLKQGVAEGGILKSIKRGLQGWDKNAVGPGGEKLGDPRDIVKRAKAMDTDTAKKVRSGLDAASDHSPAGLQKRVLDRKLKGVAEETEQIDEVSMEKMLKYVPNAVADLSNREIRINTGKATANDAKKVQDRKKGLSRAAGKIGAKMAPEGVAEGTLNEFYDEKAHKPEGGKLDRLVRKALANKVSVFAHIGGVRSGYVKSEDPVKGFLVIGSGKNKNYVTFDDETQKSTMDAGRVYIQPRSEWNASRELDLDDQVEESLEECGMMGGMSSQPHSPASINMTAATGEELSGMLRDIMQLAGRPMQEPMGDMEPMGGADGVAVVDVEPSPEVGPDEPSIMRSMIDRLNPEVDNEIGDDDDEKTDETYDNSPDVHVAGYDAAVPSGNDLHKQKQQYPATQRGDNPMAVTFESLMAEYKKFINEN